MTDGLQTEHNRQQTEALTSLIHTYRMQLATPHV